MQSSVRLASFTDGLSHTFLLGERTQAILTRTEALYWHWWHSGYSFGTLFDTFFPMNPSPRFKANAVTLTIPNVFTQAASGSHTGGAHFAFADGSARFVKDTIQTWTYDPETGRSFGVVGSLGVPYRLEPGTRPGVYQALSTRRGGEIIDRGDW